MNEISKEEMERPSPAPWGVLTFMVCGIIGTLCLLLLSAGCALTPEAITRGNKMVIETIDTLEQNVINVVEGYNEKLKEAYAQGLMRWFEIEKSKRVDAEGKIIVVQYEQLMANMAIRQAQNKVWLASEKANILASFEKMFAVARHLEELQLRYNQAYGIPPETLESLINNTIELAEAIAAAEAADPQAAATAQEPDWEGIIDMIGRRAYTEIRTRLNIPVDEQTEEEIE